MKRKWISMLVLAMMAAGGVFAQEGDAAHKHSAGDMLLGLNWSFFGAMMNTDPVAAFSEVAESLDFGVGGSFPNFFVNASIDLPKFFATARILNLGLSYEYYVFHWMSVGTGLGVGPEVNVATKGGRTGITVTGATTEDAAMEAAMKKALEVVHIRPVYF
ncbi:hypothetical protein FACS1894147_09810 [Spirochaetia bacterium]|nr:hypothetical protein FACS1894147_09810 [Spirochaetia bacterium]